MNAKAEQKERTRVSILDSACRLLRERGIAGARVADVMQGAGLTVGGFYAHFASKEALVDEAIRLTGRQTRERLFAGLREKPEGQRVETVLRRYLSTAHRDERAQGCPLPAIVGSIGLEAEEHRESLGEQISAMASELEQHLPANTVGLAPRHAALALLALMYGGLSLSRALAGTPLSDEVLKACRALGRAVMR